jgi:mono/diheme cytochrome c family protein
MRSLFAGLSGKRYLIASACVLFIGLGIAESQYERDYSSPSNTAAPSNGTHYDARRDGYSANTIKGEALDEAMSGGTLNGTPVARRTAECFPAEPRDLFWQMDQVVWDKGHLEPLNFDEDRSSEKDPITGVVMSGVTDNERDAIRGRNTWLLWGGGNETFWNWLQQEGYGLTDFLILMDSRERANRFKIAGLINQPGFESSNVPLLGLYFDQPKGGDWSNAMLRPPPPRDESGNPKTVPYEGSSKYDAEPERYDAQGRLVARYDERGHLVPAPVYRPAPPAGHPTEIFTPWTTPEKRAQQWAQGGTGGKDPFEDYVPDTVRKKLPQDGLDTNIYGYPSGIFGLRLMLNPDFFADTKAAEKARIYWKKQVEETNGGYYTDASIHSDPKLVRPFRVTMSCGFCHVAQHPLNPPVNDAEPEWENLSSIIGAQYWDPRPAFGNLLKPRSFLYHFLKSQAPGTIDTSLVSTDHINNTNVINPIFDVPSRLLRAMEKPTETQDFINLLLPSIEDPDTGNNPRGLNKERHFPMVLGPGEDSVGVFGALARVPLNIGVFSEEWQRTGNLVLGYTPQRPHQIAVGRANSVYWNVNEKYRVPYMAKFFELGASGRVAKSTAVMKLKDAMEIVRGSNGNPESDAAGKPLRERLGDKEFAADKKKLEELADAARANAGGKDTKFPVGRDVFLDNCAICHSSKLPKGFDLRFERTIATPWDQAAAPATGQPPIYTLPMEYIHWNDFRHSPAMADFRKRIHDLAGETPKAGEEDEFIKNNFLSNELRIPITLTGTYSGRAMATNAMAGHVWANYSSETFKHLKSVGDIRYFNPFRPDAAAVKLDPFGTNDQYTDGRPFGGPGYFRPATLISIWATAPFFHNNALGIYTHDPSVKGRLIAFDDAVRKLLWKAERPRYERNGFTYVPPGDLRPSDSLSKKNDPGYIYRLPTDTYVEFEPGFIPLIIKGLLVGTFGCVVGTLVFYFISVGWWLVLVTLFVALAIKGRARHAGILLLLLAVVIGVALLLSGVTGYGGTVVGALMMGMAGLLQYSLVWLWCIVGALAVGGFLLSMARWDEKGPLRTFVRVIFVVIALVLLFVGILTNKFLNGRLPDVNPLVAWLPKSLLLNPPYKGINVGPIPRGTPINLIMNLDPDKRDKLAQALVAMLRAIDEINRRHLTGDKAYTAFEQKAGPQLIAASKVPDMVLDRGHWFGEFLSDEEKEALIVFLKTL